jgi:hypothetical protein
MNILVWPQYSMRSYITNLWLLEKDANFKLMKYFTKIVKAAIPNANIYLVIPHRKTINYIPDFGLDSCTGSQRYPYHIAVKHAYNAGSQRYNFDYDEMATIVNKRKIDTILCPIEKASYFRQISDDIRIVSFIHYLDIYTNKCSSIFLRDLDGANKSDLVYFNTEKNRESFSNYLGLNNCEHHKVLDVFYSEAELSKYKTNNKFPRQTILYLTRLSDLARTKSDSFLRIADKLIQAYKDKYSIIVTDPNYSSTIKINSQITKIDLCGGPMYKFMAQSHIIPVMYDLRKWASVGIIEAAYLGAKPIFYNGFSEFYSDLLTGKANVELNVEKKSLEYNKERIIKELKEVKIC